VLTEITRALTTVPGDFHLNRKVERRLAAQLEAVEDKGNVDWALAELLSIGSLLAEGIPVRLSGQDSIRGTFSHRHAGWFDSKSGEIYVPLNHIRPDQARFCAYNSMLSEAAVLGFEISPTVPRSSSTSSSPQRRTSGSVEVASSCCCPTATKGRDPSTRTRTSSVI
jgi:2-oxoglutarate dehydrogenase complex dehydrogenase (E1) component-like enzyme